MHPALPRLLLTLAAWAAASTPTWAARPPLPPIEGEVIVQFKADASVVRVHALSARASASAVRDVMDNRAAALGARTGLALQAGSAVGSGGQVVRASGMSTAALLARLKADPEVAYAVPNQRVRRAAAPNDPLYAALTSVQAAVSRPSGPDVGQWYLRAPSVLPLQAGQSVSGINAEAAWARTTGSASVVVAVLDTGVRTDHPDLLGRLLPGYDFVSNTVISNDGNGRDADPNDPGDWVTRAESLTSTFAGCGTQNSSWHGTATTSLVGAAMNNAIGMAGVAPGVSVLPVRVLGKCFGSQSDILDAMRWAAGLHVAGVPDNTTPAKVLNMSLGGCSASGDCTCNAAYQSAVNDVLATGAVIVAAAGNSDGGPVEAPGNCVGVIGVAAIRHVGTKVGFSSLGPEVGISAPGGNCVNTTGACLYPLIAATNTGTTGPAGSSWFDSFSFEYGTSFSAPLVAGTAGLMFSARPTLTGAQLRSQMLATARPFPTTGGTAGVQACRAPSSTLVQDECYCTATTCGQGMLNAASAIDAVVSGPFVTFSSSPVTGTAGQPVNLRITGLELATGRTVRTYAWTLIDVDTGTAGFTTSTNADTASLIPAAAGTLRVQLRVTDSADDQVFSAQQLITVLAAPSTSVTPTPSSDSGGGGGTSSPAWLALLALAVAALFRAGKRRA